MPKDMKTREAAEEHPTAAPSRARLRHFSRSLPMQLLRARESVMQHFRAALRDHDLTEQQWRILRALTSVVEIEATDLARATCLLGPSLSRILRDLETRGLIERRRDTADMRRAKIRMTAAGAGLIERISMPTEATYGRIVDMFGQERMRQLMALLAELEAVLNEAPLSDADQGRGKAE